MRGPKQAPFTSSANNMPMASDVRRDVKLDSAARWEHFPHDADVGVRGFGRSSFWVEHRLSLDGAVCVECAETRVWVVRDPATGGIKSQPVPDEVRAKFGLSPSS